MTRVTFPIFSAAALPFFLSRSVSLLVVVPARLLAPLRSAVLTSCLPAFSHDLLTNRKFHAKIKSHTSALGAESSVALSALYRLSRLLSREALYFLLSRALPAVRSSSTKKAHKRTIGRSDRRDFSHRSDVLSQVFKGSAEIVAPEGLTIPAACVIMISTADAQHCL